VQISGSHINPTQVKIYLKPSTSQATDKNHIISYILSLSLLRFEFPPVASVSSHFDY